MTSGELGARRAIVPARRDLLTRIALQERAVGSDGSRIIQFHP